MIILYLISTIILGSSGDALNHRGNKTWGHILCAVEVLMLLCGGPLFGIAIHNLVWYVVGYALLRAALFDIIWALVAGQKWYYIGESNLWGRFLSKFPVHGVTFARVVFLATGIGMLVNELNVI